MEGGGGGGVRWEGGAGVGGGGYTVTVHPFWSDICAKWG